MNQKKRKRFASIGCVPRSGRDRDGCIGFRVRALVRATETIIEQYNFRRCFDLVKGLFCSLARFRAPHFVQLLSKQLGISVDLRCVCVRNHTISLCYRFAVYESARLDTQPDVLVSELVQ